MNRKMARETIMQTYFQMDIQDVFEKEIGKELLDDIIESDRESGYISKMIDIITDRKDILDKTIEENLKNWSINRISKIDLSILRVAIGEILFIEDIPINVSINEAIELAKKYGTESSPNFINGILGSLVNKEEKEDE